MNNKINNISFGSVTPITATKNAKKKLTANFKTNKWQIRIT